MRIAVAGATGVVGRKVVDAARARGHDVIELARSKGVDLTTGAGLDDRLDGVAAVVDVTSAPTATRRGAEKFFGSVTRTLLEAERRAAVPHHVVLSIVGIDDVPSGYYYGKRLQERLVVDSDLPWSILRATQFHEFADQVQHVVTLGPFSFVPRMLSQPIAASEVAEALVDVVEAGPSGRVPDLAGPERLQMTDMARRVGGRRIIPLWLPGPVARGRRSGALCPAGDGPRGRITFDDWLAERGRER